MDALIHLLETLPWAVALPLLLAENLLIFALAVGFGHLLVAWFRDRRIIEEAPPLCRQDAGARAP